MYKMRILLSLYSYFLCSLYASSCELLIKFPCIRAIWVNAWRLRLLPVEMVPSWSNTGLNIKAAAIPSSAALAIGIKLDLVKC